MYLKCNTLNVHSRKIMSAIDQELILKAMTFLFMYLYVKLSCLWSNLT